MNNTSLKKIAMFTDIHFGKKSNSIQHNQDCLDFVTWFIEQIKNRSDITNIVFMGDWFENRNTINVMTMNYSYKALSLLNNVGLPIYIIIGNHDLYHRENRKVFSTQVFGQFENITLVSEPYVMHDKILLCPFLFRNEYEQLAKYNNLKYWMGHFEFRNFFMSNTTKMESGPDHMMFNNPKYIFSGHFHKRQACDNVIYIGNTFPMDYGDAWDDERGMCILNTDSDDVEFIDWIDCPKYRKIKLSGIVDTEKLTFPSKCRVKCLIDTDIAYSEAQSLKEEMFKAFNLREFSLEENPNEIKNVLSGDNLEDDDLDLSSLNDAVTHMLKTGVTSTTSINSETLVDIYNKL